MTAGIISAGPLHAELLAAIHGAAFAGPAAWSAAAIATLLAQPGVVGLLHPDGGMLLFRRAADEAEILTLAVLPDRRRQGLGAALLLAAQDAVARNGGRTMFLEVAETNAPARAFYAAFGYRNVGRRRSYYEDGADALVLQLSLDPGAAILR